MTRKSAKRQRKPAPRRKKAAGARAAKPQLRKGVRTAVTAAVDPLPAELPLDVQQGLVVAEAPPPEKQAAKKKAYPSARCALVASAFQTATSGAVRRQLKGKTALALVLLVPGATWIEAVRTLFVERFGASWAVIATDAWNNTAKHQTERAIEVAAHLARGRPVVGVAPQLDALPSTLTSAADLTIRISAPNGATLGRAIRMFTGAKPAGINETIASGLDFHDLVAAFRKNSTPTDIIERLRKATSALRGIGPAERLPPLETAVEYGAARLWGLDLARDLADYHNLKLLDGWQDVDRGAVLVSEPGLGKTLFARILAQACGVPLLAFSVADLFANSPGYLDSVIKASRAMFAKAEALAPCILFLDELDALPNRATMSQRGADWWTPVITDFLLSLDNAVSGQRAGVVVIGATNNLAGVDTAILRPGRLERVLELTRPDHAGALNILRHHLNGSLAGADLTDIGHLLAGCSGAEIMLTVRSARRIARYANRDLTLDDLVQSIAPIEDIAPGALMRICVHESGHAIGSLAVPSGVLERCVVGSTSSSAGRTIIALETDDLLTRDSVERRAVALLCARAAEALLIGSVGLGSGGDENSDLALVTQLIATLHASTGLGGTLAYLISFEDAINAVRADLKLRTRVERHMRRLQARAYKVVREHRDAVIAVAEQLRIRRRLSGDEIQKIFDATRPAAPQVPTNP